MGSDDNWSDAQNWSLKRPPKESDDAVITNMTHNGFVNQDVNATIKNLTINPGAELIIPDRIKLQINGDTITVDGLLKLNSNGRGYTTLSIEGSIVTLKGSGSLTMSDSFRNYVLLNGKTFINQLSSTQGIQGSGNIFGSQVALENVGVINAIGQKQPLLIFPSTMMNAGVLEGSAGLLIILLTGHCQHEKRLDRWNRAINR